ncbi:MAG TPA: nucleotide disphospho-sugar-binding domain-containing protein [Chloroflexota bacterium]|nr:nucleotide disphospho-sugar-binding domain-containing protein [Chloroflexota bacterium]
MTARRTRVLLIGEGATLAHVARPAVLARALPADEFEVVLACAPRFAALFPDLPCPRLDIYSVPSEQVLANARRGVPLFDAATLERYVVEDLALLRDVASRLVVGDLRLSLNVSAPLAGVPFVNVINAQWSPYSTLAIDFVDHPLENALGPGLSRWVTRLAWPFGAAAYCLPLNLVRVGHGLPPLALDVKAQMCAGDYVVYPDVPELVPVQRLPANHRYLGPVLWSPPIELPPWWTEVPTDRPVVYVNLGSSGASDLLPVVLDALADLPVTVLAATAGRGALASVPANAFVAPYLPGDRCVERARLTISNGGTMSGQQSLAAGVPVLGLVTHGDQLAFARAVRAAGAGDFLPASRVDRSSLARLARGMLSRQSQQQAAARLAGVFARYDAAARFRGLVRAIAQ